IVECIGHSTKSRRIPRTEFSDCVIRIVNVGDIAILVAIQRVTVSRVYPGPLHHRKTPYGQSFTETRFTGSVVFERELQYFIVVESNVEVGRPCEISGYHVLRVEAELESAVPHFTAIDAQRSKS